MGKLGFLWIRSFGPTQRRVGSQLSKGGPHFRKEARLFLFSLAQSLSLLVAPEEIVAPGSIFFTSIMLEKVYCNSDHV